MANFTKAAFALLTLAACTTPQQKAAQMQAEMERDMVVYGPACGKLGYSANSDQWRQCVLQLSAKEDMQRYGDPSYSAWYGRHHWGLGGRWGPYW